MSATLPAFQPPPTLDPLDFHKVTREVGTLLPPSAQFPRLSHHVYEETSMGSTHAAPQSETLPQRLINEAILVTGEDSTSDSSTSEPSQGDGSATSRDSAVWRPLPLPSQRLRLNKFVRRLHDMLVQEKDGGVVEWRRGLLVLHSTDAFTKSILPKHFNTRNFKTFRRQLNYYGFIHVRSFNSTGSSTTALWVNRELANAASDDVESVLLLKRVEPCEAAKTAEGRRVRKEQAIHTVEEDLGVNAKSLQLDQIRAMALRLTEDDLVLGCGSAGGDNKSSSSGIEPLKRMALAPPPSLVYLRAPVVPIVKEDDKASAANLLLLLSKSG